MRLKGYNPAGSAHASAEWKLETFRTAQTTKLLRFTVAQPDDGFAQSRPCITDWLSYPLFWSLFTAMHTPSFLTREPMSTLPQESISSNLDMSTPARIPPLTHRSSSVTQNLTSIR